MLPHRVDLRLTGCLVLSDTLVDPGVVLVAEGHIAWIGPADVAPQIEARHTQTARGIVPGYIDLHVHGAGGGDFSDGTLESLERIRRLHALHGTTALCPTVLSGPPRATLRALEVIRAAAERDPGEGARVIGAHLEGPFLNPARAGAQPVEHLRPPDPVLLEEYLAAAGPALRIMTLAPELPGALDLIERLAELGVVVAMGHSQATYDQAMAAVAAGCRLATHTFNAMAGLHHREPGAVGAVLLSDEIVAEVIADLHHVGAPVLRLLWRVKGPRRVALVTDCTAALEAGSAPARLGGQALTVEDGAVRLGNGRLAGSVLTLDRAVRNAVREVGVPLIDAVAAASLVPARVLEVTAGLEAGNPADLLLLDEELRVETVIIAGRILY
jgi:N-acetylglucosamine-6-phosphate deacetylase